MKSVFSGVPLRPHEAVSGIVSIGFGLDQVGLALVWQLTSCVA